MLTGKLVLTNELKKLIDHRKEWSVVDVKPRNQITCNSFFEREINNSSIALSIGGNYYNSSSGREGFE